MGTSGYSPSSDDAWDAFGMFEAFSRDHLLRSFHLGKAPKPLRWSTRGQAHSGRHWTMVGVLELHMWNAGCLPASAFVGAALWLDAILRDNVWLEGWEDPKLIARSVQAYLTLFRAIAARLQTKSKRRRRKYQGKVLPRVEPGWSGWPMNPPRNQRSPNSFDAPEYLAFQTEMKKIEAASTRARRKRFGQLPQRRSRRKVKGVV